MNQAVRIVNSEAPGTERYRIAQDIVRYTTNQVRKEQRLQLESWRAFDIEPPPQTRIIRQELRMELRPKWNPLLALLMFKP